MNVQQRIESKLRSTFALTHLEVINESHMHNVPADAETHFKVIMVSDDFEPLSRVQRHQAVNHCVRDELAGPVHALSLKLFSQAQWQQSSEPSPSPQCLGGGAR